MMETERRYRGQRILRCHWADDPHGGRWYVQSYHDSGMPWADEATPHHRTLAEAREYIREGTRGHGPVGNRQSLYPKSGSNQLVKGEVNQ